MRNYRKEIAITDHTGRPEQVIDGAGGVLWQATYDAYGAVEISAADIEMPLRYPGQYDDGAGWGWYNWHRTYIPELGGYAGIDPLFQHQSALYGYAGANPLWYVDPEGLSDIADKAQCYYDMAGGDWEKAWQMALEKRKGHWDFEGAWIEHYAYARHATESEEWSIVEQILLTAEYTALKMMRVRRQPKWEKG